MAYTEDPQVTMFLTVFAGIAIEYCNLAKRYALRLLHGITMDPKKYVFKQHKYFFLIYF